MATGSSYAIIDHMEFVDDLTYGFINGKDRQDGIWTAESLDLGAGEEKGYTIRHSFNLKDYGFTDKLEQELKAAGCWVDCAFETFHTMDAQHSVCPAPTCA
jgi:hypothetical protein